ncbi:MAG: hypothetical protein ACSHYB_19595 [Roseibacillus sp.]
MKRSLLLSTIVALCVSNLCRGHQDTRLKLEDKKIIGLPERYEPASFVRAGLKLTIGGKTLVLPKVLNAVFTDGSDTEIFGKKVHMEGHPYKLVFSASWYHDDFDGALPPYMLIRVEPSDCDYAFEILVNMDELKILRADVSMSKVGKLPIDLDGVVDLPEPE